VTTDAEVLELISNLARQDRYVFTLHAKERLLQRHLTDRDVKEVLLHPIRVIRRDVGRSGSVKYKIQGGERNRKVAVVIEQTLIVITVM
jgi:hypothetical protein